MSTTLQQALQAIETEMAVLHKAALTLRGLLHVPTEKPAEMSGRSTWDYTLAVLMKYPQGLPLLAIKAGMEANGWKFTGKHPLHAISFGLHLAVKDKRARRTGRGIYTLTPKGRATNSPAVLAKVAKATKMMAATKKGAV